ncbi:MAG: TIGR03943 family protein [Anaerolineae bacterium]|nr:TIGR03943 family protein [Anaerolineae bacterium]
MTKRAYRTFQSLLLALLGLFLLSRIWNGSIVFYINRRFVILVLLAGLGLMAISQALLRSRPGEEEHEDHHEMDDSHEQQEHPVEHASFSGWNLAWMTVPLILGLVLPARPLGSVAVANRGMNVVAPLFFPGADQTVLIGIPPTQRNILEWMVLFEQAEDPDEYAGESADVTGFVYRDPRLKPGEFMIGRFMLTCCVADALAVGMVVSSPEADELSENSWVRVQGEVYAYWLGEQKIPAISAVSIAPIPEPEQPYLVP